MNIYTSGIGKLYIPWLLIFGELMYQHSITFKLFCVDDVCYMDNLM
jgi:hypothetical protein